jgi:hypothetical protein
VKGRPDREVAFQVLERSLHRQHRHEQQLMTPQFGPVFLDENGCATDIGLRARGLAAAWRDRGNDALDILRCN